MGSNASSHSSKEERKEKCNVILQNQINNIDNINRQLYTSNAVVDKNMKSVFKWTNVAKTQLERNEKPLTKSDLIAIMVKIGTLSGNIKDTKDMTTAIEECNKYTVGEMNSIIRCAIYDVPPSTNSGLIQSGNNNTNNAIGYSSQRLIK